MKKRLLCTLLVAVLSISGILILVVHFLCEAHHILDGKDRAVIQCERAAHPSEDLMLIGNDDFEVQFGGPVKHRFKAHLETMIGGGELPGLHDIIRRNDKGDVIQLVDLTLVEDHVFRRGFRIAETIADVPA